MRVFDYFEKLQLLHRLIQDERTGSPQTLANRLNISRATLYNIIDELKSMGVNISYSKSACTFFYKTPVRIDINFQIKSVEEISANEAGKMGGGCSVRGDYNNIA